ncbi:unnamed protein product [Heligmosomoides polygyrus]|uniref:C2 domain-containing protein n=1 Tax=Heligmosomoides polygyrus TaxID=6339 RepID=A0A3P7U0H5_HELPZ|nr:unnamed protein product [Heligmosomoides polygyrus]
MVKWGRAKPISHHVTLHVAIYDLDEHKSGPAPELKSVDDLHLPELTGSDTAAPTPAIALVCEPPIPTRKFTNYDNLKSDIADFFESQPPEFWAKGIGNLPNRWATVDTGESVLTNQVTAPPTSDQQLSTEESPILPAAASQRTDSPPYPVSPEQNTDALQDGGPTPDATPKPHKGRCFPGGLMGGLTGALVGGLIGALPPPIPPFGPIGPPVGPGPFLPPGPVGPGMFFPPGPAGPGPWWPNPPMAFYPNGPVPFFPFGAYSAGGPSRRGHAAFESFNGDAANRPVQPPSNNSPQEGEKNLNGPAKRLEHEPDQAEKGAAFSKDDPESPFPELLPQDLFGQEFSFQDADALIDDFVSSASEAQFYY